LGAEGGKAAIKNILKHFRRMSNSSPNKIYAEIFSSSQNKNLNFVVLKIKQDK